MRLDSGVMTYELPLAHDLLLLCNLLYWIKVAEALSCQQEALNMCGTQSLTRSTATVLGCFAMLMLMSLGLGSCASDIANRYYGEERYDPKAPEDVQVLRLNPTRPFKVIADFQARLEDEEDMRRKAAEIGADAVIVRYLGGRVDLAEQWATNERQAGAYYSRIVGTAIKYISGRE
ncbi:MAG: hypothetical protein EXS14_02535 [Planctomycetes bacterium]|nr:hypothetical protein [Planctomycetota bacterium]